MTYKDHGDCDKFCHPPDRDCSPELARPGCYCEDGYVRLGESAPCVLPEDCVKCGEHMVFEWCGTPCPKICGIPEPIHCNFGCGRGCFCKKPYILKSLDSLECVLEQDCP
ncbi:Trypsin Inhibitor like cysteine rich domain [Popillia japonica]|uniref:Trypsin Inhibitor like cysteine rich domain n=1 Tax=Popillia japonica TaxID=7064 RepID=A0AAW1HUC6_POPJA